MKTRKLSIWLISITMILSFGQCDRKPEEIKKIKVGYLPIIANLPTVIAREKGFFLKGDINIEFQVFSSSNELQNALDEGDIDISPTVAVAPVAKLAKTVLDKGQKDKIRVFSYSKTTTENPFDGIFVKAASKITRPKDLAGKKIGVFPGTTAKNICGFFLQTKYQIDVASITWVGLPPNVQIDALKAGDIDALYTYEPTCTIARLGGFRELHGSVIAAVLEGAPYGASAINRKFEMDHPELAQAFIQAFDKAIAFIREHEDESRSILEKELSFTKQLSLKCNLEYRYTSEEVLDPSNVKTFQEFVRKLVQMNEISGEFDAEMLLRKSE